LRADRDSRTQHAYFNIKKGFRVPLLLTFKATATNSLYQTAYQQVLSDNRSSMMDGSLSIASKFKSLFNIEVGYKLTLQQSKIGISDQTINFAQHEVYVKPILFRKECFELNGYHITAFRVKHNVVCYGYTLEIPRAGRFQVEKAKKEGIPIRAWNPLQKGETIEIDGVTYSPDMVMGAPRKGIKLTYCTDSRPMERIHEHAKDADLFICEGMYGEPEKIKKAKQYKHMTFYEAAEMAKQADVKEMWLTHYSPSLVRPERYIKEAQEIFPRTSLGKDGRMTVLDFEEDEA
jgi:ribonuclease Z